MKQIANFSKYLLITTVVLFAFGIPEVKSQLIEDIIRSQIDLPPDKYDKLYYTIRSGDNVGYVADWYDVRASDLRYWNNISRNLIRTGQRLVIYKPKGKSARYKELDTMSFAEKQHFAGRTVSSSSTSAPVPPNRNQVNQQATTDSSSAEFITYTVRRGDTLWEISRKYPGTTETEIARLNNITNAAEIKPGQVIRIKPKG